MKSNLLKQEIASIPDFLIKKGNSMKVVIENKPLVRVETPKPDMARPQIGGQLLLTACHNYITEQEFSSKQELEDIQTLNGIRVLGLYFTFFKFWFPNAYINNILNHNKVEHNLFIKQLPESQFGYGLGLDFRIPEHKTKINLIFSTQTFIEVLFCEFLFKNSFIFSFFQIRIIKIIIHFISLFYNYFLLNFI